VDYGAEAAELIDLSSNAPGPGDGREISGDDSLGAGCRCEGVTAPTIISPMQDDVVALFDQELGRHETKTVRRSGYEDACHFPPLPLSF
jgi:hypothetical protein